MKQVDSLIRIGFVRTLMQYEIFCKLVRYLVLTEKLYQKFQSIFSNMTSSKQVQILLRYMAGQYSELNDKQVGC